MRRRFMRRAWLVLALFLGLIFLASAVAVALLAGAFGLGERGDLVFPVAILGLVILVAVVAVVVRVVRRTAGPVGEVMEGADRVAAGDYSARVPERGPADVRRLARSFNAMAERLEAAEAQRRNLLADVTHELRTPLSVIRGDVEGMLDGVYPPDREHLEPVVEEARVMSRLLDDLRTLSTAEAGALKLHRQKTAPKELAEDAVAAFRTRAAAGGVQLEERVSPGLPDLDVDPTRIGEVLANLVHNALRHTPVGGTVVVSADPASDGGVAFAVDDTGAGIPPGVLPYVFDRFVRGPDSGGAGLGLAIARSLVEAHGGTISADSGPEGGTVMRFVLPARP
jgi:two-component system sensor histidine kinase BaeS